MTSESFGACGCPVTSAGVMHNYDCHFGGMRARAYTRASANEIVVNVIAGTAPFGLTDRELQVAKLMVKGRANKQIALALGIEIRTVKAHMSAIMRKTSTGNRTEAAYRIGSGLST